MNIEKLINNLVAQCHPLLEIAVFDMSALKLTGIEHALSDNKSDIMLRESDVKNAEPFIEYLLNGKTVKTVITKMTDCGKKYIVRSRLDITPFQALQQQFKPLLADSIAQNAPLEKARSQTWRNQVDNVINEFFTKLKSSVSSANRSQKRDLVFQLYKRGLLNYKESSSYVANYLGTSRATIYNYINWAKDVSSVQVHQVNAFTEQKFGGNPAGVVLDAENLSDEMMSNIAREMNLSETSFVLPDKKTDFRLRYFTASGVEVNFCGHSTVGALHMLADQNRFDVKKIGITEFNVATNVGNLAMQVVVNKKGKIEVSYQVPKIDLKKSKYTHAEIAEVLGITDNGLEMSFPVMFEKTNKDIFITVKSLAELSNLEIDYRCLKQFCKTHDIVAFCLLTNETADKKNHIHTRCFAPAVGINEDPFTGSVLGGLVAYVHCNGLIDRRLTSINVEQGHNLQRPGSVVVNFRVKKNKYSAQVFAKEVPFFSTEIQLIKQPEEELIDELV